MAEPRAKLRPGVRLSPGGRVILSPTQIMAIMELAEMAHCRHQRSSWVQCQLGRAMLKRWAERRAGKQGATFVEWEDGGKPFLFL